MSSPEEICTVIQRLLPQYVRQELESFDQATWAAHLATCSACRREADRERRVQRLCRSILRPPLPEPPGLAERIRTGVLHQLCVRFWKRVLWRVSAALGVLLLGEGVWQWSQSAVGWGSVQRLAHRAHQEYFWAHLPKPAVSYEEFETAQLRDTFLEYGLSRGRQRDYRDAIRRLEGLLHRQPHLVRGWMTLGTFQLGLAQIQSGLLAAQRALDLDPKRAEIYRQLSEAYRLEGRFEEALKAAEQSVALAPKEAWPYYQRAAVQANQAAVLSNHAGFEAALRDLTQAEARDPDAPEIYLGRGSVYLEMDRFPEAAAAFQEALNRDPSYHRARVLLGLTYCFQSRFPAAISEVQQVLQEEPDYPLAHLLLGMIHDDNGEQEAAITAYQRALEANPWQEYIAYRLGRQYAILDRPQAAREAFAALVEEAPDAYMLHLQLGLACQQLGQFDEAIRELQTARNLQPQSAYAQVALASALHAAGQSEPAFAALNEAVSRCPEATEVFEALYALLRRTPTATGPAYQEALAALAQQRGPRTQRFLATVEEWVEEKGILTQARPGLVQAWQLLREGDVLRAEERGADLCDRYDLGFSVTLGPENQESGLKHLDLPDRDGGTEAVANLGGRSARRTCVDRKQNRMFFDVPGEGHPTHGAWVLVDYWDAPDNRFLIEYDSTNVDSAFRGVYERTENVWKGNTKTWRRYVFWLPDAAFRGRQHGGADFRLFSRGWRDTAVHSVRVLLAPEGGELRGTKRN